MENSSLKPFYGIRIIDPIYRWVITPLYKKLVSCCTNGTAESSHNLGKICLDWTVIPFGKRFLRPILTCFGNMLLGGISGTIKKDQKEEEINNGKKTK